MVSKKSGTSKISCYLCGHVQHFALSKCLVCKANLKGKKSPPPEAKPSETKPTEAKPKSSDWLYRAQLCLSEKKYKEAVVALSHAIREDGNNGSYYYKRAVAYNLIKDIPKAMADLKKAVNLGHKAAEPAIKHLIQKHNL